MKVGFIGTGTMGGPMAANVLAAGNELAVFDTNRASTTFLEELGAIRCADLESLVNAAEVVLMSLPGPTEVEVVATELLELMANGQTLIDMSTNSPALIKRLAVEAQNKGIGFLDAPVSGGVHGAKGGTLAIMVGGSKAHYDRFELLFKTMGANIFHVGDVGAGNVAKLINNMLAFSSMMANAEALVLGAKAGIDLNVLYNVVRTSSGNSATWEGGVKRILRDKLAPSFTLDLACKDIGLATELANQLDVDLTLVPTAARLMQHLQDNGFGKEDILTTIKALEESVGVTVRGTWQE